MDDLDAQILGAQNGDADAFGALVLRFQDMAVGYGYSMLRAARRGDVARVRYLLRENPRLLGARDWLGNSALVLAVNSGHQAVADLLFAAGVQPDIHEAAATGHTAAVVELVREDDERLDSHSAEGFPPLALSAHFGHADTTRRLIAEGANLNAVASHPLQVTPLHAALFGRRDSTARLLIEQGADVNLRRGGKGWPRAGWTALHYSAAYGFIELIPLLIARGAGVDARDDDGKTPLDVAVEEKQEDAASMLSRYPGAPE